MADEIRNGDFEISIIPDRDNKEPKKPGEDFTGIYRRNAGRYSTLETDDISSGGGCYGMGWIN